MLNDKNFDVNGSHSLTGGHGSVYKMTLDGTLSILSNSTVSLQAPSLRNEQASLTIDGTLNVDKNVSFFMSVTEGKSADVDLMNGTINLDAYASINFSEGVDASFTTATNLKVNLYGIEGALEYDLISYSTSDPLSELVGISLSDFEELIAVSLSPKFPTNVTSNLN